MYFSRDRTFFGKIKESKKETKGSCLVLWNPAEKGNWIKIETTNIHHTQICYILYYFAYFSFFRVIFFLEMRCTSRLSNLLFSSFTMNMLNTIVPCVFGYTFFFASLFLLPFFFLSLSLSLFSLDTN